MMWVCLPGLWRFPEDRIDGYGLADYGQYGMNCRDLGPKDAGAGTLWLVELIAPTATADNKIAQAMLSDLKTNVFPDKTLKFHHADLKTGERKVSEV